MNTTASVWYEWDIETVDEHGDVQDHNHSERIPTRPLQPGECLVLVRNQARGPRSWAYVSHGVLPEWFIDAYGQREARVPKRFHREFLYTTELKEAK